MNKKKLSVWLIAVLILFVLSTYSISANARYVVGNTTQIVQSETGDEPNNWKYCPPSGNWIVAAIYLLEMGESEFSWLQMICSEIDPQDAYPTADISAGLNPDAETREFFDYNSMLNEGFAEVSNKMPIGLQYMTRTDSSDELTNIGFRGQQYEVFLGRVSARRDSRFMGWALRDGQSYYGSLYEGSTHTLMCPDGFVITGIGIAEDAGNNSSQIKGLGIECKEIVDR